MARDPRKVDRHALWANPIMEQAVRGFSAGAAGGHAGRDRWWPDNSVIPGRASWREPGIQKLVHVAGFQVCARERASRNDETLETWAPSSVCPKTKTPPFAAGSSREARA